jgi:hypothetical protein
MKLFTLLFFFLVTAHAQIKPVDQQYMSGENYLLNNGFESGRTNWTQTGTATATLEQSIVRFGVQSYKIVASSQTVDLSQVVTKYAAQSGGQQGIVSVFIKNTNPLLKVCAVSNSVDTNCLDVLPNDEWKEYAIPFVLSATNNGIRIKSASDTGTTYIDNAFVGVMPATMMPEISQAHLIGSATYPFTANCSWVTASAGTFPVDNDCPAPTLVGSASAPSTKIPAITFATLPAGTYKVMLTNIFTDLNANLAMSAAITDGTSVFGVGGNTTTTASSAPTLVVGEITYTSPRTNITFQPTVRLAGANDARISNTAVSLFSPAPYKISVFYYPPKSKIYSGDTIYPHAQLLGKVNWATSANCVWLITGTTIVNFPVDADCANPTASGGVAAPSTKIPAVVLPAGSPKGTYKFIATALFYGSPSADSLCSYRFSDGTNNTSLQTGGNGSTSGGGSPVVTGEITYDSALSSATTIQIQSRENTGNAAHCSIELNDNQEELNISVYYFPPKDNPIIGTFAGIEKCADDFECTDVFSAKVSSTGVVSGENLDWINGNCTVASTSNFTCSFNSGIFTVAPNCVSIYKTNNSAADAYAERIVWSREVTSTSYKYATAGAGTLSAVDVDIICQKQGSDYKPKTAKAATTNEMMYVPNVTRPKTCYYAFGGAGSLGSQTNCGASPCVEYYDSCSAGTAPTRAATGNYQNMTFANGTWKANTLINCTCTSTYGIIGSIKCDVRPTTLTTNSNGGYQVSPYTTASGVTSNNAFDSRVVISCTADAP